MEKLLRSTNRNINLDEIDFISIQNSDGWVGYINFIGENNLLGIDLTIDLFYKFFEQDIESFFSLNTLAYDKEDDFFSLEEYSSLYSEAKEKKLIYDNWDELIKISYDNPLHSDLCRLDFNWSNIVSISKLIMAIDSFSDINLLIGNFLIINPKLNIMLSPRGIGFDVFCLNRDTKISFDFIKFFSKFNNFKCYLSMKYLLNLNKNNIKQFFSLYEKIGDYSDVVMHHTYSLELKNIVKLKNINFSGFSSSNRWIGYFEVKQKEDNNLIKEAISLFNNFFKYDINDFFLLSSLASCDNGAISEEFIDYIDIYKKIKEENIFKRYLDKKNNKNIKAKALNLCFDYDTFMPLCELVMVLSFNNIFGQICFLINPKLQIALYPHDDIGFGVIALNDDPTLGIKFLKFCENDSRFRVYIESEGLN